MFLRQRVLDFDFWLQVMFSWHSVWTNEMLPNFSFTNNFDLFFKLFLTFRSCDHHTILKYRTRHFLNLRKSTYFVFAYIILPYNYFIYIYKILRMIEIECVESSQLLFWAGCWFKHRCGRWVSYVVSLDYMTLYRSIVSVHPAEDGTIRLITHSTMEYDYKCCESIWLGMD